MRDYTKIEAWRLADDLTVASYERTRSFPREEIYGLTSQLRRAAYSGPANIVEGASREVRGTISIFSTSRVVLYPRLNIFSTLRSDSVIYHRKKPTIFGSKRR
jgi:hypothetical protein